ncbi:helix-turn-helix domain-containing protein [Clostridium sp. MCC353]|uniref:helix-turn-helix domain-containing protein n=1 Tax=Clostridium sp. MCC353 TaxID=2592646 RepID=UPI001C0249E9|nr:helix-turn-helix domain-containing protein [Clostridium sp. MCC353]
MNNYLTEHLRHFYNPSCEQYQNLKIYSNKSGWNDFFIGQNIVYSHRTTSYIPPFFPEKLHTHTYYEICIFLSGKITYVVSSNEVFPVRGGILCIPPGISHTARLIEKSEYDRMVFYFDTKAFEFLGPGSLPAFLCKTDADYLTVSSEFRGRYYYLLEQLNYVAANPDGDTALQCFSLILQLLLLIEQHAQSGRECFSKLPSKVLQIKNYIDLNFQTLTSTAEIADHFFYSREYISRIFKQYFNTNLSEYIMAKKIEAAKQALNDGQSVTQAFSASGYRSMSAFINAFRTVTSMQPSAYRKQFSSGQTKKLPHH